MSQVAKTTLQVCGLMLAIAFCAFAANTSLAGKWTGTVDVHDTGSGTDISTPISLVFDEPQGASVSGKIAGNDEEVPIKNGKLDGDQLTFEASSAETSGPMKFTLKFSGDRMEGQMKGAIDTQEVSGTVKITRQK